MRTISVKSRFWGNFTCRLLFWCFHQVYFLECNVLKNFPKKKILSRKKKKAVELQISKAIEDTLQPIKSQLYYTRFPAPRLSLALLAPLRLFEVENKWMSNFTCVRVRLSLNSHSNMKKMCIITTLNGLIAFQIKCIFNHFMSYNNNNNTNNKNCWYQ